MDCFFRFQQVNRLLSIVQRGSAELTICAHIEMMNRAHCARPFCFFLMSATSIALLLRRTLRRWLATAIVLCAAPLAALSAQPAVISARGLSPAVFGMTPAQLSRATGEPLPALQASEDQNCFYLDSTRQPGVSFMFEQGRLRRIDISTQRVATVKGVGVGSPISRVKAKYGSRIKDEPHHCSGPEDRYFTVALSSTIAIRFETSAGRVSNFYVGEKQQVQYVEGCS